MSTRDERPGWTTRDELMADLSAKVPAAEWDMAIELGDVSGMADALIAEGWRKKPSREEMLEAFAESAPGGYWTDVVDAILALMDRGQ